MQVDEGELLAGRLGDGVAVPVELDVAVGAHVHQHVDLLFVQPVQLLLRHPDGDRRVDEPVAEAGPAVRLLLVVGAGGDDAGGDEQLLRHHEVLVVAQRLVREDLAVVAGGVGGHLDAVEPALDELGHAVVRAPQDLEGVLVLRRWTATRSSYSRPIRVSTSLVPRGSSGTSRMLRAFLLMA